MKLVVLSSTVWGSVFIRENMNVSEARKSAGLKIYTGTLHRQWITLIQQEAGNTINEDNLLADLDPDYVISLGEAFSGKRNLEPGDMVISSEALYLDQQKPNILQGAAAEMKLVDLGIRAAEKFNNDERICKVVVGKVFLDPGTAKTGRKLTFMPREDIYCLESNGYPMTKWVIERKYPFVLVKTIIPVWDRYGRLQITQFRWDTAKKNFWIVRGIFEGLKKMRLWETPGKVDLI